MIISENEANNEQAAKIIKVINGISVILFVFMVLLNNFFSIQGIFITLAAFILLAIPLVAFYFIRRFDGIIKLYLQTGNGELSIGLSIFMSSVTLLLISFDCEGSLYSYANAWIPSVVILVITTLICFTFCRKVLVPATKKMSAVLFLIICLSAYSFGATVFIDKYFDNSSAKEYTTTVLDKSIHTSSKGHRSYWLYLHTCGLWKNTWRADVPSNLYDKISISDTVNVYFKNGYLGIPWYAVQQK